MITTEKEQYRLATAPGIKRRLPVGAEIIPGIGVHFRVWAPDHKKVEVMIEGGLVSRTKEACALVQLDAEEGGYFSGVAPAAMEGTLYRYRLDEGPLFPDPASRFQPEGPHGPSQVVDPSQFAWTDKGWAGATLEGQVLYEMHIGTFTPEGTWNAARRLLPHLADTGITVIEMMPVGDFPGWFGWGYDGVSFFAPTRLYGTPDELRKFVDTAHSLGMGVILDVVYNHTGPDGCFLQEFSHEYFTDRYVTEWGSAFNFDGKNSGPVRELMLANAQYWIEEFHIDGLRLDATQSMHDASPDHIIGDVITQVRAAARGRSTIVIGENEPQQAMLAEPVEQNGCGMDGLWNDDFHHSARVSLTGTIQGYYCDYRGTPQEFISAAKWGYLYQGQFYEWQQKKRGTPSRRLRPENFVIFLQNHDQVANSARGSRIHQMTSPGRYRAMTAVLLLMPGVPLLFQGQEFAASSPFLYFAHHVQDLASKVKEGRKQFLSQFSSLATGQMQDLIADPGDRSSFNRSKLDFSEREIHHEALNLHKDLLLIRRKEEAFRVLRRSSVDGAVLGESAFVLRFLQNQENDCLLLVNMGRELDLRPAPEPLLAPPRSRKWELLWSSEDPRYGGSGTPAIENGGRWHLPGESAMVMAARMD